MVSARGGWIRVAQWLVGLAIVVFAARSLARNWAELRAQPLAWQVEPGYLLLSAVVVWSMYALLVVAWRTMLLGWGQQLDGWTASRIWTVSSLGKYLPGKVWAVAGMALMAQRAGIAPWAATGSAVVLQALAIGSGAAVAGLTGRRALEAAHPGASGSLILLVAAAIAGVLLLMWPPFIRRVLALASPGAEARGAPPAFGVAFGIVANVVAWLGYGMALWLLARGLLPEAGLRPTLAITVFTASYLAGFLALFAPGGLGVREGLFILMLQGPLGIGAATALALASRVLLTITEFGAAVPFLVLPQGRARVAP
ncbi:MAG TPA: lysylphosphatidylglycerol synthase domain-containing protein [Gemmatimonadales bacterium]|nr:lysylphosphatidylglycerol synthase domain-containing protein [Gemmatimonadales bacterium]